VWDNPDSHGCLRPDPSDSGRGRRLPRVGRSPCESFEPSAGDSTPSTTSMTSSSRRGTRGMPASRTRSSSSE